MSAAVANGRLALMLTELRLPTIKQLATELCGQADREGWPGARLLEALFEHEIAQREVRRIARQRADSQLPPDKLLSSFDFAAVPSVSKAQVSAMAQAPTWLGADDLALNAREPVLDLVEPRRIGRREVDLHVAVRGQEVRDALGLVAADVVADNVNLAALGLVGHDVGEKGDELLAGVTRRGPAEHLAGGGVECGKKAQRAVALVLEAVALGAARRERQHPVLAVQRLDRGLLVHAEHRRVRGRVQVQADHVGGLGLEVRIVRDHVPLEPVRSYAVLAPDALHRGKRHVAQLRGKLAAAPVGRAVAPVCA